MEHPAQSLPVELFFSLAVAFGVSFDHFLDFFRVQEGIVLDQLQHEVSTFSCRLIHASLPIERSAVPHKDLVLEESGIHEPLLVHLVDSGVAVVFFLCESAQRYILGDSALLLCGIVPLEVVLGLADELACDCLACDFVVFLGFVPHLEWLILNSIELYDFSS